MTNLERYYNKFNEEHRLTTRHGMVEYTTTMKYIHDCIGGREGLRILDIGAGTGRYSVPLSQEGHNVTAVELVERNLKVLESKHSQVNCWPGNALDLHFLKEEYFDITLIFGPLYHLHTQEERLKAFEQARRVTKKGGIILAAYVMDDYSVITYCFKQHHALECRENNTLTKDFHSVCREEDLYCYLRLNDINELNEKTGLERMKIIAADGSADYIRKELNEMSEEEFSMFLEYHLANCERMELLGASSHTVDILRVPSE